MTVVLKKEDMSKLSNEVVLSEDVSAPVEKGQKLGAVAVSYTHLDVYKRQILYL